MKIGAGLIAGRNQLQWVVLLLAASVVLPTVSLLWFISRVVSNERLVIREKLSAVYQDKLAEAARKTSETCAARLNALDRIKPATNPYSLFTQLVLEHNFEGAVILDESDAVVYPTSADVVGQTSIADSRLTAARQLEFNNRDYAEAAQLYDTFSTDSNDHVAITAIMGSSRCLSHLGRLEEAVEQCKKAAFGPLAENPDVALPVANARLLLLSLLRQSARQAALVDLLSLSRAELLHRTVNAVLVQVYNTTGDRALLPANQNLFIAKKLLQFLQEVPSLSDAVAADRDRLEKLVAAEEFSISVAENLSLAGKAADRFFRVKAGRKDACALWHKTPSVGLLLLFSDAGISSVLAAYDNVLKSPGSSYRIVDASGNYAAGTQQPQGRPFISVALADCLPGWKVELFLDRSGIFDEAAKKQIAVYIWTGALVILLILVAGGFAARAVGKQIRLNKMKNDFIATVSHELKTPLASMRVLVDTLLESNVKDERQAKEYLRLTARENERLSRMIDNFLTFSRMERNKKAFTVEPTSPAEIANDAAETVRTKLTAGRRDFVVDIADNLPQIQADHDAMVTVVVNLLDNACKYTPDPKHITLKVTDENNNVCFAVSDNGIGLSRRQIRKIFDSFYQVDSSLARRAEGCGLGLSIVKFIVDAHKGTISVDSRVGKGSTFTVRISVSPKSMD